jgi:hypothetical protein
MKRGAAEVFRDVSTTLRPLAEYGTEVLNGQLGEAWIPNLTLEVVFPLDVADQFCRKGGHARL